MKKQLYLLLLLTAGYGYAQNTFPTQGNVGIGILTPQYQLDVSGSASITDSLKLGTNSIWLGGVNPNTGTNNHIYSTSGPLLLQSNGNNQNTIINNNSGKVGIGTVAPISKLHLKDRNCLDCPVSLPPPSETVYLTLEDESYTQNQQANQTYSATWQMGLSAATSHNTDNFFIYKYGSVKRPFNIMGSGDVSFGSSKGGATNVFITGKLGIGTTAPNAQLTIQTVNNDNPCIALKGNAANQGDFLYYEDSVLTSILRFDKDANGATLTFDDRTGTQPLERFKISGNGTLYAREVKVTLNAFPDYVFEKDYNRLSLLELEEYINTHKHLPNIPSAQEVEEDGIGVGELQIKMMEKIEELTLYIIEQNKKIEALEQKVNELSK